MRRIKIFKLVNRKSHLEDLLREKALIKREIATLKEKLNFFEKTSGKRINKSQHILDIISEDLVGSIERYVKQKWFCEILFK